LFSGFTVAHANANKHRPKGEHKWIHARTNNSVPMRERGDMREERRGGEDAAFTR
jgi:hypothetical protein